MASTGLDAIEASMARRLRAGATLQHAANAFVDALVARAPRTTVLARVLVTRPYRELPPAEQAFADGLARTHGVRNRLRPETPVLALLATRGREPAWNDPRLSRSHRAVPLTDGPFVRTMPMVGRMLEDLGFPVDGLGPSPERYGARLGDRAMGVFHVPDASAPEAAGMMSSRDFVVSHGIRSVFGLGSVYLDGSVLVVLVFSRDIADRETVVRLAPLAAALKQRTYAAVAAGRIFDADVR